MEILNEKFIILSKGFDDTVDITQKIKTIVANSKAKDGLITVTSTSPTVSFLKIENTKGLLTDIKNIVSSIVPVHKVYEHDNNWHDGNAFSHLKSMLMGNSTSIALINGDIQLPADCSVALIDFNNKSGQIQVVVTIAFNKEEK